jgi:hypothetical protein
MRKLFTLTLTAIAVAAIALPFEREVAAADADALRSVVEAAGGKVTLSAAGEPVSIDLYNGNNPMKGKGGRNMAVNDAWLEHLAGATSLIELRLTNCDIHGPGLEHIAGLTKLENLNLTLTPVTDEHFVHLAGLTELKSLGLASTPCTGSGFTHLGKLTKLTNVNLHHAPVSDAGLSAISRMPSLTRLWVAHAAFTDAAAPAVANFGRLERLGLGSFHKESSGKALAGIAGVPLVELDLLDRQATDEAVAFAAAIPTLRRLSVTRNPAITDAAIQQAKKSRPDLTLEVK